MEESEGSRRILARFKSDTGQETEGLFDLPIDVNVEQLNNICSNLLKQVSSIFLIT